MRGYFRGLMQNKRPELDRPLLDSSGIGRGWRGGVGPRSLGALGGFAGIRLQGEDGLADGGAVPLAHVYRHNFARYGGGDLYDRLVCLQFDDGLILGQNLSRGNEDVEDLASFDVLSQVGKSEFNSHVA